MSEQLINDVTALLRDVPDFPKPGILFKDITPVLQDGPTLRRIIDYFAARYQGRGVQRHTEFYQDSFSATANANFEF